MPNSVLRLCAGNCWGRELCWRYHPWYRKQDGWIQRSTSKRRGKLKMLKQN